MPNQPNQLFIKPVAPTANLPARNHIYARLDDVESRKRIAGFSYYGEVGGLKSIADGVYVKLDLHPSPTTNPPNPNSNSTAIHMTFDQWFDLLKSHKVNMSRVFVYPDREPAFYLFDRVWNSTEYDINMPGSMYLTLLQRYIQAAERRGIIVQITLAGTHSLRPAEWVFHPMNGAINNSQYLSAANGNKKFFKMRPPNAAPATDEEKWNYAVQSKTLDWILNASNWSWNVIYELFNEPTPDENIAPEQRKWLITMAKWLDERLRARNGGVRRHLVSMNASKEFLTPDNNILKELLFDEQGNRRAQPLIDVFSFHGAQWGEYPGKPTRDPDVPDDFEPVPRSKIENATRAAVKAFYNQEINFGNNVTKKVQGSPVALIMDSDAHYYAQDSPDVYGGIVMRELDLDYNHRWHEYWLSQKRLCKQLGWLKQAVP